LYTRSINKTEINNKKEYIGLDSGIRVFQTGFSENHCIDFGYDVYDKLKVYLQKIDKLNANQNIENEIERCKNTIEKHQKILNLLYLKENNPKTEKNINKLNRLIYFNLTRIEKLDNMDDKEKAKYKKYLNIIRHSKANYYYNIIKRKIDDLHWKTASELAKNYKMVIISKFSMKSVCEENKVVDMVKRVGTIMRHHDFRSKLVYKCLEKGTKIMVSEEKYTTKTCSICGHYNEKIIGEKEIECEGCKRKYPRDKFSARGLVIKNLK
jgi:transposase